MFWIGRSLLDRLCCTALVVCSDGKSFSEKSITSSDYMSVKDYLQIENQSEEKLDKFARYALEGGSELLP